MRTVRLFIKRIEGVYQNLEHLNFVKITSPDERKN
jgi:hypothetical protein